jgi:hypothetical protein
VEVPGSNPGARILEQVLASCLRWGWTLRGRSSIGRAPALQAGGCGFDPHRLHFSAFSGTADRVPPLAAAQIGLGTVRRLQQWSGSHPAADPGRWAGYSELQCFWVAVLLDGSAFVAAVALGDAVLHVPKSRRSRRVHVFDRFHYHSAAVIRHSSAVTPQTVLPG